jgi:hypothetical protein
VPRYLEQSLAEEEHDGGVISRPELAVDRQAQYVAVEAPAPVQIGRLQQDAAAEYLHPAIFAGRLPGDAPEPPNLRAGAPALSLCRPALPVTVYEGNGPRRGR